MQKDFWGAMQRVKKEVVIAKFWGFMFCGCGEAKVAFGVSINYTNNLEKLW